VLGLTHLGSACLRSGNDANALAQGVEERQHHLVESDLADTRRALKEGAAGSLIVDDLTGADLADIGWSGTAAHVRAVADALEQVRRGKMEYLAIRSLDGAPVAKAGINYGEAPGVGTIAQMATHGDLQGLGLGSRLIAAAETCVRRRGLEVARIAVEDDNPRARALYERHGYVVVGRREVSWQAEAPDGSLFLYRTVVGELDKALD
jgi:ribosomal protein S18 acetylase RimI-like enzyme